MYASVVAAIYEEKEALVHANLATAAYCGYPKFSQAALEAWKCGPACDAVPGMSDVRQIITSDQNDAYAIIGRRNGDCIVMFRGTSNLNGWMSDLKSTNLVDLTGQGVPCSHNGKGCQVGDGFMSNYNSIASFIKGNLTAIGCKKGDSMTVGGHSLGAAEAVIAMYDLRNQGYTINQTYTFGEPRVGDRTFVEAFEADIGGSLRNRVTHYHDPIPHLPTESFFSPGKVGFVHGSLEVYYGNENASQGYKICDGDGEDSSCADADTDVVAMVAACVGGDSKCDHLTYMMPIKNSHMDGTSCVGSDFSLV